MHSKTYLLTTLLTATAILPSISQAALIASESFNIGVGQYTAGVVAPQNPTATGFTGGWANVQGTVDVVTSGLNYSNGSGTVADSGGALQANASTGERAIRSLSVPFTSTTTGIYYMSVMLKLTNSPTGYNAFELNNGANGDATRALQLGQSSNNFTAAGSTNFGLRLNDTASISLNLGAMDTNTHLFVMKFTFGDTANSDSITVWNNPSDLTSEVSSGAGQTLGGININFDRMAVGSFIAGSSSADEFRLGTEWRDVTTVPEPSAALLGGLGVLGLLRRRRN